MLKFFNLLQAVLCFFVAGIPIHAEAFQLSVGLGGAWQSSPYRQHDAILLPMPLVYLESERFSIRGLSASVYIWKTERQKISLGFSYSPLGFDPKKTDDSRLGKLNGRHSTVTGDLQYALMTAYGHAAVKLSRDILGKSDAFSMEASYVYPFMLGTVSLCPGVGLRWDSKEQLRYYFGVSASQAVKSGLAAYTPGSGISPFLTLDADWRFAQNWSMAASGQVRFLSAEMTDSPMVDKKQIFSVAAGITYTF